VPSYGPCSERDRLYPCDVGCEARDNDGPTSIRVVFNLLKQFLHLDPQLALPTARVRDAMRRACAMSKAMNAPGSTTVVCVVQKVNKKGED